MKKLEDISKNSIFEVPDGYFEGLPGIIQARVSSPVRESAWAFGTRVTLRYALPVLAISAAAFFFLRQDQTLSAEELLASVDTGNLVAYLGESDINTDELLEIVPLNQAEADAIGQKSMSDVKVDSLDVEYLQKEFVDDYF